MAHHTPLPIVFTFLVVSHLPATAQEAAPEPPPLSSPELAADGSVAFAMPAPNATNVMVRGQWPEGQAAMAKGEDGVWRVTVGPVPAGVWEYRFEVDGLSMIDPLNHWIKPMHSPRTSILHVPGNPPLPHDFQDVPHGVVHQHTYRSASLGRLRDMAVYTPPGYDAGAAARYPVLYLQHGNGDNEGTWVVHGKAHWILDNLIAAGRAKPMLIVMLDGHAVPRQGRGANTERFEADLLNDAIPYVEQRYRVIPESTGRALVGLSMGGRQALTIGLRHSDLFGWIGGFSASGPDAEDVASALEDPATTNERLALLWLTCGKDDHLMQRNEEFVALLAEKGIDHEWRPTEGDHSWPVWRHHLADLAPVLFR